MAKRPTPKTTTTEDRGLPVISVYRQNDKYHQFVGILRMHDQGVFAQSASLLDELMTDDRIYGVAGTRIGAILSAPMLFNPAGPQKTEVTVSDEIARGWEGMFSSSAAAEILKWGQYIGLGFGKIVWEKTPSRWQPRLVPWNPGSARWDDMSRRFVVQTQRGTTVVLPRPDEQPRGDGQWFVYCPYGVEGGWRSALIRPLALKYLSRQWTERDHDRLNERQGMGIIKAKVPAGNSQPGQRDEFFKQIANVGSEAVVMTPQDAAGAGFDVSVVEFTARTWESMVTRRANLDTDIAIAILGQNLTTEVKGGSLAASRTQNLVRLDYALRDAKIAGVVRDQLLTWYCEYNHGDPELAPTPTYEVEPPDDDQGEAVALKTMGEAGQALKLANPRTDVEAIWEANGIPQIPEEEMAEEVELQAGGAGGGGAEITPSAAAAIMRVDEARALIGLGPMLLDSGAPDPDGKLTVAQFQAKYASIIVDAAKAEAGRGSGEGGDGDGGGGGPPDGQFGGDPEQGQEEETAPPAKVPEALAVKARMAVALSALLGRGRVALGSADVKKRYSFAGLDIAVEHPAGSIRLWIDPDGKRGATKMGCDYGYIDTGHLSGDEEELDCYVGDFEAATEVYVIHQRKAPRYLAHDEDKCMLGFASAEEAKACYLAHRDDGDRAFGTMTVFPVDAFKAKLRRRPVTSTTKIRASVDVARAITTRALVSLAARSRGAGAGRTAAGKARAAKYQDALTTRAIELGARALAPALQGLKDEIDSAESLAALRKKLPGKLRGMDLASLADVLHRTNVLSRLAGRDSATKET